MARNIANISIVTSLASPLLMTSPETDTTKDLQEKMNPGIRTGTIPPFHELDEYGFQDMCRDLFQEESSIATCEVYGGRGQSQYGIDILAHRNHADGLEVGQCKCYSDFPPRKIRDASDEFFAHWEHWSGQNIKRFILFVACDLTQRQRQDEIIRQRGRFAEYGITYEAWSAAMIRNKLRPHPGIVSSYLTPSDHWVRVICGENITPYSSPEEHTSNTFGVVNAVLSNELELLGEILAQDTQQQIESMRAAWREGRKDEAIQWVEGVRENHARWLALSPIAKAALLRFAASLELETGGDVIRAQNLADEARGLTPSDNQSRLRALITYRRSGPEAAIDLLYDQTDVDSINLKAGFLLEMGRLEECQLLLQFENADVEPNAFTFRVRALMYLLAKDLGLALIEINKALELAPNWQAINFTAAVIDYFRNLSPSTLVDHLIPWPDPIAWALVKRDDESLLRFQTSGKVFLRLAERPGIAKDERQTFETWRLACLANDPNRHVEASEYCKSVLQTDPTHFRAIAWAAARNLDVDLYPSERALAAMVVDGSAEVSHILGLASSYLAAQKFPQLTELLESTRSIFQERSSELLWTLWYVQSLVAKGDSQTALTTIDDSGFKSELKQVRAWALVSLADENGDCEPLVQHLEDSYEETGDSVFLLECCQFMIQRQEWDYVAERAEQLVKEVATNEALRLAAIGTYNANKFDHCLQLLDEYQGLFSQGKLPAQLRRIRTRCLQSLGSLPQAVADAHALAQEEPTAENLFALAQFYFAKGDFIGLISVAHRLVGHPELTTEQALIICQPVRLQNQGLARELWKKAQELGIPDDAVGMATSLGYQLGLDNELGPLQVRMNDLGQQGRGGIQIWTLDDVVSFYRERGSWLANLSEIYNAGTGPVHIIAEQLNTPLADIYHGALEANERSAAPLEQPPLFARHGGRTLISGFPESGPQWRLNVDITAVLLAEHLGILDKVAATFPPLRIPADLIPALIEMQERITTGQPSRLPVYQQIVDLADQGLLRVSDFRIPTEYENPKLVEELGGRWVAIFETARDSSGYLIDFLPLSTLGKDDPPSSLPHGSDRYFVNCRAIAEALRQRGPLSEDQYISALEALGSEGRKDSSESVPEAGAVLFCHANIPEVLADANLLRVLCSQYQVHIEKQELDQVRLALEGDRRKNELGQWVNNLISKLSEGVDKGTYQIIPLPSEMAQESPEGHSDSLTILCLRALLSFEMEDGDVVWADDRYINSYSSRVGGPVIAINEVLKGLVSAGVLDVSDYYEKVNNLRAANVRFIPVQKDEILFHLKQALVVDGAVVETQALNNLRRYVSACLLQGAILQRPSTDEGVPNGNGEVAFVVSLTRAITDALVGIWAEEEDEEFMRRARAEWVMEKLYIDHLGLFNVTSLPKTIQDDRYMVAINLAGLISQAITLPAEHGGDPSHARRDYFDWLFNRVLRKRFEADPLLLASVVEALKRYLYGAQEETEKEGPPAVVSLLLQWFYEDLPDPIRRELWRDHDFMARIGLKPQTAVTIAGLNFDPDLFWQAACEAVNGGEATITAIDSISEITLRQLQIGGSRSRIELEYVGSGTREVIANDLLEILVDSPIERESVLRQNRHWFDCPEDMLKGAIAEILSIEDPRRRIEAVESWQKCSASVYYGDLLRKASSQSSFGSPDILPPSVDGLIRHFRLPQDVGVVVDFQEGLNAAAKSLVGDEGVSGAIDRLAGLPVTLPQPIMDSVAAMSKEERRALIKQLLRTPGSPISRINFIHLLLHLAKETPAYLKLARRIGAGLLSPEGDGEFGAFLALLRWTNDEFSRLPNIRAWPAQLRLAIVWAHTHRLFTILVSSGAPPIWIQQTSSSTERPVSLEMFERKDEYWYDIAHPRRVRRIPFLIAGFTLGSGDQGAVLVDERLRQLLGSAAFPEKDGKRTPDIGLYSNPNQLRNSICSFLDGNYGERLAQLLGLDMENLFTQQWYKEATEQAVERLIEQNDDFRAWMSLYSMQADLPPDENLAEKFKSLIRNTDFAGLVERNVQQGILVIHLAALLVTHLGDEELRQHLKISVVRIAQLIAKWDSGGWPSVTENEAALITLESALDLMPEVVLNLSLPVGKPESVVTEFVDIATNIVETSVGLKSRFWHIAQRLCEELPISQSQKFWPLLLRLRAS